GGRDRALPDSGRQDDEHSRAELSDHEGGETRIARVSARSSAFANACFSRGPYAAWPPVSTPELRRLSMKFRTDSRSPITSDVYSSPRGSRTTTPFGTNNAARGMSAVTATSPETACSTI